MRNWLFYKIIAQLPDGVHVQFRRPTNFGMSECALTSKLHGDHVFHGDKEDIERHIEAYVRREGWVAEPPRNIESPIGSVFSHLAWDGDS